MNDKVHPLWAGLVKGEFINQPLDAPRVPKLTKFCVGEQVGYWTLLEYILRKEGFTRNRGYFKCQCVCGKIRWVKATNLTNGKSRSCGCQQHTVRSIDVEG